MIEVGLKKPSTPWGRMCLWVENHAIGDFDEPHCGLDSALSGLDEACKELSTLWCDEFNGLSCRQIWNYLDGRLYGFHGNEEIIYDELYEDNLSNNFDACYKFNFLTNWGEMFDRNGKSFLLNPPGTTNLKILNFFSKTNEVKPFVCSETGFRKAVKDFSIWYEKQVILFQEC